MADYTISATHQLNHWLWSRLQLLSVNSQMAFAAYLPGPKQIPVVPIIPSQQVGELNDIIGGAPYVVYNYTTAPIPDEPYWMREQVAFVIYDNQEERLRGIYNYMVDLLRREDWTARAVNDFLGADSKWDFKSCRVTTSTGPDNYSDPGGKQSAMVVCQFEYTHLTDGLEGSGLRI